MVPGETWKHSRERFQERGVVHPVSVITPDEATRLLAHYYALHDRMQSWTDTPQLPKVQVLSKWVWDLVSNDALVDAVENLIGPDILCWGATFFAKPPATGGFVGWHQDLTYWGLSPADQVVTAWLGLTDAHLDNGCMSVIQGSHRGSLRQHRNDLETDNMLLSGQEIALSDEDMNRVVHCELEPGQASIHHSLAIHGSNPNRSTRPRIGLSINYISADVAQSLNAGTDSASPVRGDCRRSVMQPLDAPVDEFSPASIQTWKSTIAHPSGLGATATGVDIDAIDSAVG